MACARVRVQRDLTWILCQTAGSIYVILKAAIGDDKLSKATEAKVNTDEDELILSQNDGNFSLQYL